MFGWHLNLVTQELSWYCRSSMRLLVKEPEFIPKYPYALLVRFPLIALLSGCSVFGMIKLFGEHHTVSRIMLGVLVYFGVGLALIQLLVVPWGLMFAWDAKMHRNTKVQMSLLCGAAYAWFVAVLFADISA